MARMARVVAVGVPHHVTQRGNNRQDVFLQDEDRRFYLETLRKQCELHGLAVLGYCLMTNHVHLVAIPRQAHSLARGLGKTHPFHAQRFNRRYGRVGHLWQNRFFSCPLGRSHREAALAYVDLNPVRAGLVGSAGGYPWSSAAAHLNGIDPTGVIDREAWNQSGRRCDWGEFLSRAEAVDGASLLRRATLLGTPLGEAEFVARLEQGSGRRLRPRPPGPTVRARAECA
jgi:putative transposase